MKLLLDTHALLWALSRPERLGAAARAAIESPGSDVFVSAATIWEAAIKRSLGKLTLPGSVRDWLVPAVDELGAGWLAVGPAHAASVETLPLYHRDPFDRLLVVQAFDAGLTLVTHDRAFAAYGVPTLWK